MNDDKLTPSIRRALFTVGGQLEIVFFLEQLIGLD